MSYVYKKEESECKKFDLNFHSKSQQVMERMKKYTVVSAYYLEIEGK